LTPPPAPATIARMVQRELIGDSPDRRLEILCERDALHATWSRFAPGRAGADLHVHRHHTDVFYVIDGELTIRLGVEDERVVARSGTLVLVPAMVVHGFLNASDADMRYLNLHAPGLGFADYLRALRDGRPTSFDQEPPPADGIRPTSEAIIATGAAANERVAVAEVEGAARGDSFYVLDGGSAGAWIDGAPPDAGRMLAITAPPADQSRSAA
jgi:mannose-6-phosphate isomerase-like protein (cupin superfamily)